MNLLSIQSHVVFGHVGNAAVTFPLQRLGHTVWPVPTVVFSNHAGYPDFGGGALAPALLHDVLAGLDRRGALACCDGVLSGYLGSGDVAGVVLDAVARVRETRADALYCCDPVMGDAAGGLYVAATLPALFRERVVPQADIVTPNLFELAILTETDPVALAGGPATGLAAAASVLLDRHPRLRVVLVTSAVHAELDPSRVAMVAVARDGAWLVETPRIAFSDEPHGAGDLAAALFLVDFAAPGGDAAGALAATAASLYAVLTVSARAGGGEMALVEAGDALVDSPERFAVRPIA